MNRTLLVLGTHFVDESVISEYIKMKNTPNVDAVLAINNTDAKIEFTNRIENKKFFDTDCKCFFFDSNLHDEMKLPYFTGNGIEDFNSVIYHNGDYRFYYLRKIFPNYDYYWQIEYDVFCNAETYEGFLKRFNDNHSDLLIQSLNKANEQSEDYIKGIDWIYNDIEKVYSGIFAVVRLSAQAIDFLYKRRLEHEKIFKNSTERNKCWVFCEVFVPTEFINNDFKCENLDEKRVQFSPYIYFNEERIFLKPDNHLYHPVKHVRNEISKLLEKYENLFFCFRKNFLIHLQEKLISNENIKNLQIRFNESFNAMVIDLAENNGVEKSGLRCEVWFLNERMYGAIDKIYAAVIFEGKYLEYFKILEKYIDLNQMPSMQILENDTCRMLAYHTKTYDNVSQVANVVKILIEMTFTILKEELHENN